jgi:hypothetical protein
MGRYLIRVPVAEPAMLCGKVVGFRSFIILLSEFLRIHVIWLFTLILRRHLDVTVHLTSFEMSCCQCIDCVECRMCRLVDLWWPPWVALECLCHTLLILVLPRATSTDRQLYLALCTPTCKTRRGISLFCTIGYSMQVQYWIERERESEKLIIPVFWGMAMCRLGDWVIGSCLF